MRLAEYGLSPISLILALLIYLVILFWVARLGDRHQHSSSGWPRHPMIYALALGVYCTSWTFYGLVGTAAMRGWYYLPILLGPILMFTLGFPILQRIASICRQEHIHSVADMVASRYGKRQSVAALVTVIMLVATVPYIALQLKAVSDTIVFSVDITAFASEDMTLLVTATMVLFTLIFGANRLEVSSYHSGLMSAIAFESVIKMIALMVIALFAFSLTEGFDTSRLIDNPNTVFERSVLTPSFMVMTLVSAASILCLPRMFHVTFVECLSDRHLKAARKGFSVYLVVIAISVFIIAWVGNQLLADTDVPKDMFVLALPLSTDNELLGLLALIGGFSAATAMIIVASVTLSQMLTNDVILPILLRRDRQEGTAPDYSRIMINMRRLTVIAVAAMGWFYQSLLAENVALTSIGLVAFALAVQLAPAILIGLFWVRGNASGVFAGLAAGSLIWFIMLMLPLLANAGVIDTAIIRQGIFGIDWLRPQQLFGFSFSDNYTRAVILSMGANIIAYVGVSMLGITRLSDRIQAVAFVHRQRADTHVQDLQIKVLHKDLAAVLRQFLGGSATERLLKDESRAVYSYASAELLDASEKALSGVVGVASARALLNSLQSGQSLSVEHVVSMFEETTRTLQFNQDMMFASFESISSAISVVNEELKMVAWNRRYEHMFNYPEGMLKVGIPVEDLIRFNATRGMLGPGEIEEQVRSRLRHLSGGKSYRIVRNHNDGVIEIKGRPLRNGGYVTTYDDITEFIDTQQALEKANLNLEQRVADRTREIGKINDSLREEVARREKTEQELIDAKSIAEKANAIKTRFLALASHDVLQPINAANLYTSALLTKHNNEGELTDSLKHLHNAIRSAELIISNLLEVSRLDTGTLTPNRKRFPLNELLEPLVAEFRVQTQPGVDLRYHRTSRWTESDPKYLRRILQNFLSNAVKYTEEGKVVIGCRRSGDSMHICIIDTGPGISDAHQQRIFDDFYRIGSNATIEGAGLGLGIALRFSELLGHEIKLTSGDQAGSVFSVEVPLVTAGESNESEEAEVITTGLKKMRVFCVDDDDNNLHAMGTLLLHWGCEVESANNFDDVLAYAREQQQPDAVLIDYQLDHGHDGIELSKLIAEQWPAAPLCIVSAAADIDLPAHVSNTGHDFLRKPVKPGKLRALLERYRMKQLG